MWEATLLKALLTFLPRRNTTTMMAGDRGHDERIRRRRPALIFEKVLQFCNILLFTSVSRGARLRLGVGGSATCRTLRRRALGAEGAQLERPATTGGHQKYRP